MWRAGAGGTVVSENVYCSGCDCANRGCAVADTGAAVAGCLGLHRNALAMYQQKQKNNSNITVLPLESTAAGRFSARVEAALQAGLARVHLKAALSGFIIFMVITAITMILWIGGRDLLAGKISAGDLSAFIFYAFLVATSVGTLSELGGELQRASGAATDSRIAAQTVGHMRMGASHAR